MSNAFYFCPHNLFYYRRVCSRKFHFPVPPSKASFPLLAFLGAFSFLHASQHVRLLFGLIYIKEETICSGIGRGEKYIVIRNYE